MTDTSGIRQSVSRASRLLRATGFMDMSRGLQTEAYQRNVREAVRELREAARSLVQPDNRGAYGEMNQGLRLMLWESILLARAPATGVYIVSALGAQYPEMQEHLHEADRGLSGQANGFPVRELHRMTSMILDASPDSRTALEQEAARGGDPMPRGITTPEAELYQRIVLRAMLRSRSEANSHRNAGDAAIEAFAGSFLPALPWEDPGAFGQDQIEGRLAEAIAGGTETAAREGGNAIGAMVSVFRAVHDAADAHYRAGNPEYRLNYWIRQGCLQESNNNEGAADRLQQQLLDIKRRMDEWLAWLQRHPDHPSYVPPSGRLDPAPRASVDSSISGSGNRSGPVQGSVRGPASRGSLGLA